LALAVFVAEAYSFKDPATKPEGVSRCRRIGRSEEQQWRRKGRERREHEDEDEGAEDRRQHVTVVDFLQKFPYYLVKPQKKKQNSKTVSSDQ
jgi:hypothetical protein